MPMRLQSGALMVIFSGRFRLTGDISNEFLEYARQKPSVRLPAPLFRAER